MAKRRVELAEMSDRMLAQWRPSNFRIRRAAGVIALRSVRRKRVPSYGIELPRPGFFDYLAVIVNYSMDFVGSKRWFWWSVAKTLPVAEFLANKLKAVVFRVFNN
jgi:hypothetical protein